MTFLEGHDATSRSARGVPSVDSVPWPVSCWAAYCTQYLELGIDLYVNVPVGAVALVVAPFLLHESRDANVKTFDFPGAVLVTAGLSTLVYGITQSDKNGWVSVETPSRIRGQRSCCWRGSSCCGSSSTPSR